MPNEQQGTSKIHISILKGNFFFHSNIIIPKIISLRGAIKISREKTQIHIITSVEVKDRANSKDLEALESKSVPRWKEPKQKTL